MASRYRCGTCRTTSDWIDTDAQLHAHAHTHRRRSHGGDAPDGEQIVRGRRPLFHRGVIRGQELLVITVAVFVILMLHDTIRG